MKQLSTTMERNHSSANAEERADDKRVSNYGLKLALNHQFPEKWSPFSFPRLKQLLTLIPVIYRMYRLIRKAVSEGRRPIIDLFNPARGLQIYGVPIGGIGCGTIGRGFKGEFCRFTMIPGYYENQIVPGNQFIVTIQNVDGETVYHQVLSTESDPKVLRSWTWEFDGSEGAYTALYPRSWTEYDITEMRVKLICRQVSPIIPHNYKDSSLPCAVFVWEVVNNSEETLNVSITFTFQNGTGNPKVDDVGEKWNEYFSTDEGVSGVMIHQEFADMPCTYAVSSKTRSDVEVTRALSFDPIGSGEKIWDDLEDGGKLTEISMDSTSRTHDPIAAAVCARVSVKPKQSKNLEFALVWEMPKVHFHDRKRSYMRYYTKYFHDPERSVAPEISSYALKMYRSWEKEIVEWQREVLEDPELPDWYKSALFNELYFVADGGTVWLRSDESDDFSDTDPRKEYGRFAYLEGHEYRMYNTYDVHFYASFALAQLWPRIQETIQYEFRDTVYFEDTTEWKLVYDGAIVKRKSKGFMPHDLGDPGEEPFIAINSYSAHDISEWKDLNTKFILVTYRDYMINKNVNFLQDLWPTIKQVADASLIWDTDDDGLIENQGFPDQTYDTWVMTGPSAYCGSLWLAALRCCSKIAEILGEHQDSRKYKEILDKGKIAFQEKLWNGKYYNFDSSNGYNSDTIMADQLCGQWFLQANGFGHEVFPKERVKSALETIFENNVMKFKNGNQGAVNGCLPSGQIDINNFQSEEMWIGVTYGVAALMLHEGMTEKAFKTAEGAYRTVYETLGLAFQTPEALYENKTFRALGYMRALSIWGMQYAWQRTRSMKNKFSSSIN